MREHRHSLKMLRDIVFEHGTVEQPDLALMARELGQVVYRGSQALAHRFARLSQRQHGFRRWRLNGRRHSRLNMLVLAWPPGESAPMYTHERRWSMELPLYGALEVQTCKRDPCTGDLHPHSLDWLGPGDCDWFETDADGAHRCRNLSRHEMALSLHVCGGDRSPCPLCNLQRGSPHQRALTPWRSLADTLSF